jgi:Zn-dependent metalloprotease
MHHLQHEQQGLRRTRHGGAPANTHHQLGCDHEPSRHPVPRHERLSAKNADGSDVNDPSLDQTFNGFQTVHNFYETCFGRNSIDGQGLELRGTIHLSRGYDNAFWDSGKKAMFFGDGGRFDGRGWLIPDPKERGAAYLTNWHAPYSLDILGHELTHGVVQHTANLGAQQYENIQAAAFAEAGTLDEHVADCFGIMVKQFSNNEVAESASWELAPGWYSAIAMQAMGWEQGYMRTFRIPDNKAKQADTGPKHMKELVPWLDKHNEPEDPHTNVGIPNHAFYLAAQSFGGHTWETVGKIWYAALTDPKFQLPENQTFREWRDLTTTRAEQLLGASGKDTMEKAWQQVGL